MIFAGPRLQAAGCVGLGRCGVWARRVSVADWRWGRGRRRVGRAGVCGFAVRSTAVGSGVPSVVVVVRDHCSFIWSVCLVVGLCWLRWSIFILVWCHAREERFSI